MSKSSVIPKPSFIKTIILALVDLILAFSHSEKETLILPLTVSKSISFVIALLIFIRPEVDSKVASSLFRVLTLIDPLTFVKSASDVIIDFNAIEPDVLLASKL